MNIIFHHPLPLNPDARSASGIRPLKMLAAFKALGYRVDVISGYSSERKEKIEEIKKNINSGERYEFVYSESSTMPTILTDPHHLPLSPLLDFMFFRFCQRNNIKVGVFYRDIYWAFENYGEKINFIKRFGAIFSYKYELYFYKNYLEKLYLPSLEMGSYIPIVPKVKFSALPPGHDIERIKGCSKKKNKSSTKVKIFYVGGMVGYDMHVLFSALNQQDSFELTICTRENEWNLVKDHYPSLNGNIKIIHKIGEEMSREMQAADLVSVYIKPEEYRDFAVPYKLFEYLGNGKPIIASEGTLAGKFVSDNSIGWTIPYEQKAINKLLDQLTLNPELICEISNNMSKVAAENTWVARAEKVAKDLKC